MRLLTEATGQNQTADPLTFISPRAENPRNTLVQLASPENTHFFSSLLMLLVAWVLLPTNHPTSTIPWREIGFFMLISTFVLWALRLLVKLLLSHIHLYADAQEREVMISTYMALIRRKESRESLSKDDIAIVLAPIFRPSTTGVIKDEGSPVTLTDFISRIAGK